MPDPNAAAGAQMKSGRIGGNASMPLGDVKATLKVDVSKINTVKSAIDGLNASLTKTKTLMDSISTASSKMQNSIGGATGVKGSSSGSYLPSMPPAPNSTSGRGGGGAGTPPTPTGGVGGGTSGSGMGYLSGVGGAFYAAQVGGQLAGQVTNTVDNRLSGNMAYALPADRLSVLQQQMTGLSRQQIGTQQRQPLTNYLLGQGGINSLLTNQSQYGINAQQQASSYGALRAVSGFSLSTQDLVNIQNQLTSPQVANRLFNLTGGTNFNTAGGGTKNLLQGFQQLAQSQGLTNPAILKGAFGQGSATRANLTNLGLDDTTQTLLLQYAQENQTFKNRGGKGNYDPSNKADMKLMGISNNFATQSEETDRLQTKRDENMYQTQADNYADLEKSNQQLIKALGSLEQTFSSAVGLRARTQPWQKAGGSILKAGGLGIALAGAPEVGIPAYLLGSALGDAPVNGGAGSSSTASVGGSGSDANDSNIKVPFGYGGTKKSLSEIKTQPTFTQMQPAIKDRLLRAMREHPSLGIGGGFRSSAEQQTLFLSRYHKTDQKTGIQWNGSYWAKNSASDADAAPPGSSFHEVGLAADLVGDLGWWQSNASRFGMKTFANVNNEPWHSQPVETPNSFSAYAKSNGVSASGNVTSGNIVTATSDPDSHEAAGGASAWTNSGPTNYAGQSIQDILNTVLAQRASGTGIGATGTAAAITANKGAISGSAAPSTSGRSALAGSSIAQMAYNAGFRGQDLIDVVAISKRESSWVPGVLNNNSSTGDLSYGLMQINMKGGLGPSRLREFGLTSDDQLLDAQTNLNAAFKLYMDSGKSFNAWGGYKGKSDTFNTDIAAATKIVTDAHLGDAPSGGNSGSNTSATFHNSDNRTVNIPINITWSGAPSNLDIRSLASQIKNILSNDLEIAGMRTS